MTTETILIIGNGIAGNTAAFAIRELNQKVNITLLSAENACLYSACAFPHYLSREIPRDKLFLASQSDYDRARINVIFGCKAVQIDPVRGKVVTETGKIPFDKLIVATGSKPAIPDIQGLDKQGIFTLKTLSDADAISGFPGKKAAVIGSGLVGVKVALSLNKRGYQVSVISRRWMLPRIFDEKPSQLLKEVVEGHGINIFNREATQRVEGNGRVQRVVTDKREIECDTVIFGAGMQPDIALAKEAWLRIGERGGIQVDEYMMTSMENIYACGDCVEARDMITGEPVLSLLWHNAKEQGKVAGLNCLGLKRSYSGSIAATSLELFGTHAVSIGRMSTDFGEGDVEIVERTYGKDYRRFLLVNERLVGIQAIGRHKYLGALFALMRKKEDISGIRADILNRKSGIVQMLAATNVLPWK